MYTMKLPTDPRMQCVKGTNEAICGLYQSKPAKERIDNRVGGRPSSRFCRNSLAGDNEKDGEGFSTRPSFI